MNWRLPLVHLGLFANVLAFFAKPLFNNTYIFPWDFRYVQLPLISFLAEELHQGIFPLWDPFTYCGDPIFANIQAAFFHPPVLAAAYLSAHTDLDALPMILEWVVALHIVFAGIGAYYLFREMGASIPGAFAGAVIFETGGFFASQAQHIGAIMSVAPMPLAWLAVLRLRRTPTFRWVAILSLALGFSILGGLPQATVAVFGSTLVLALLICPRRAIYVAVACAFGVGLAAIPFLPTWQVTGYSVAKYRADWLGTGGGLHWESLVSLVYPNRYHLFDLANFKGPGDISFLYLYGSIAGLGLVIYCLATRVRQEFWPRVLACMLLFGGVWMLGDHEPLWRLVFPLLPVSIRIGVHPEFTYCIFTLAFSGLAALGLDRLPVKDRARWGIAAVIAVDLFVVGSGRPMNCASVLQEPGITRDAYDGSTELLATLRGIVNRDNPPARIDTMGAGINWAESATLTRVPAANGSSPLALEAIVRNQMLALNKPGVRWGWYYEVENPNAPVLNVMGVKYLLAAGKAVEVLKANPQYHHAASLPGYELFENTKVLPRFFLFRGDLPAVMPGGTTPGTVRTLSYQPNRLELEVDAPYPAKLFLSEAYYPGWEAWVDGTRAGIGIAATSFRQVNVPVGKHRVRMEFHPGIFDVSRAVSGVTLALVLSLFWLRRSALPGAF